MCNTRKQQAFLSYQESSSTTLGSSSQRNDRRTFCHFTPIIKSNALRVVATFLILIFFLPNQKDKKQKKRKCWTSWGPRVTFSDVVPKIKFTLRIKQPKNENTMTNNKKEFLVADESHACQTTTQWAFRDSVGGKRVTCFSFTSSVFSCSAPTLSQRNNALRELLFS